MTLHPLAARFAGLAEAYERGRPGYPAPFAATLTAELGLAPGARVLDLAAGTGKLTGALAEAGLEVHAVEPQERLRAILAGRLPAGRVREGVAEAIPFEDGAFDAVTVADAFHWFAPEAALAEIGRVLRPGGGLAIVTSMPSFGEELEARIMHARSAEHPYFDGPSAEETLAAAPGWTSPRLVTVPSRQALPLRDYAASMSWVAALDADARADLLASLPAEPVELEIRAITWLSARA